MDGFKDLFAALLLSLRYLRLIVEVHPFERSVI